MERWIFEVGVAPVPTFRGRCR